MLVCSCGCGLIRRYVMDESDLLCYCYDYCPCCDEYQVNGFDDNGNLLHYYIT